MSDPAKPQTQFEKLLAEVAEELKARNITLPGVVTGQWGTFGRYIRGGWRSAAGWACAIAIVVNAIVLPLARLFGFAGEPLSWEGVAALVGALGVLTHYRSKDLQAEVTT